MPPKSPVFNPDTMYVGKPCRRGHQRGWRRKHSGECIECRREDRMRRYREDADYRAKKIARESRKHDS